ncbi:hypothetical protein [Modestobacter sp. VKM Ac-2985]|uniref:hypothetical protein n=1 Tax=Modestobacter sp. VKM Ac-2985 TaxID=3004139 RepID=UPI0022AB668A|nr:hypothetical protein [Modestobacter sp. VKM Ac-2985]MCZ2837088.1 hypothetical protein [Modestobacter sp. VKM Ac-2985]
MTQVGPLINKAPTGGWGENGRAWGDDEFWMSVVLSMFQGVFALLTVAGAVYLYNRERSDIRRDKLQEEYEQLTPNLASDLDGLRAPVLLFGDETRWSTLEDSQLQELMLGMRQRLSRLRKTVAALGSFPSVTTEIRRGSAATGQYLAAVVVLLNTAREDRHASAYQLLFEASQELDRALRQAIGGHQRGFHEVKDIAWPELGRLPNRIGTRVYTRSGPVSVEVILRNYMRDREANRRGAPRQDTHPTERVGNAEPTGI